MGKYYTYTLAYPDGTVFYVGKGSYSIDGRFDRIDCHEREAQRGGKSYKCQIIREIWRQGGQILKNKVFETDDEQDSFIYEWCLMNLIYGSENLANQTKGGTVMHRQYDSRTGKTTFVKNQGFLSTNSKTYQRWYQPQYRHRKSSIASQSCEAERLYNR